MLNTSKFYLNEWFAWLFSPIKVKFEFKMCS